MAENIDALTLEAWKTDWVKDNIKKSAFPSDQSSWEAGDAYCVTELRVGTEVLFLMTWEFMAFNLDHEVFQVIDRMLSDDGLNFENLFSDFFYTHRIGNFIGAGPEHWFRAGFLDIGQNETQDGKPDKWSRLKDLIRFLVMMPLHICASAARAAVHLGPIRNIPDPRELTFMERDHEIYATAQSSKPQWNWYDGSAAWRQIARSVSGENLLDSVNEWLISPQRLGLRHRVVVAIYDTQEVTSGALPARGTSEVIESIPERLILVRLRDEALGVPVDVRDVGAGVPQIVPVLMAGLSAKSSFIEQPELHLHPRLQTEIADFFISAINTRSCRCVIETHSEHLALRTLRRIRETNSAHIRHRDFSLDENSVAFYYFNPVEGGTEITLLRVSPDGDFIDRWPSGFFSEREAEIFDEDD
jgi:hypothetical protein